MSHIEGTYSTKRIYAHTTCSADNKVKIVACNGVKIKPIEIKDINHKILARASRFAK